MTYRRPVLGNQNEHDRGASHREARGESISRFDKFDINARRFVGYKHRTTTAKPGGMLKVSHDRCRLYHRGKYPSYTQRREHQLALRGLGRGGDHVLADGPEIPGYIPEPENIYTSYQSKKATATISCTRPYQTHLYVAHTKALISLTGLPTRNL